MKGLSCNIQIAGWNFSFVSNIEIVSTWDTLTDTCKIEIPQNVVFKRDGVIIEDIIGGENPVFSRGDSVIVKLGYDGFLKTIFMGRVSDVNPQRPIMITCEDEMYELKQGLINEEVNLKDTTLKELVDTILDLGVSFPPLEEDRIISDIEIGDISRLKGKTVTGVLSYLRKNLGIVSYFRPSYDDNGDYAPVFVSGLPYSTEDNQLVTKEPDSDGVITYTSERINEEKSVNFSFGQNIISDEGLTFKRADDQNVKVIGKSKQKNNTLIEYEAGDEGGDTVNINYPNLTLSQLEEFVQDRLSRSKYDGFTGSFEAFLEPRVRHGETVNLINNEIPEKDGVYLVKNVVTRFGTNGARQIITLDVKVDA